MKISLLTALTAFAAFFLISCGSGSLDPNSYSKRNFPPEGKKAFEDYLTENATGAQDFVYLGEASGTISYLIEWANNGKKWREALRGAWCLFTTSEFTLKNGISSSKFVVYQTTDDEWGVNPSTNVYALVGC